MPIPEKQFDIIDDYTGLENLPVYGDLLELYSLIVTGKLVDIARIHRRITGLNERLFTVYAAFVLAHAGYNEFMAAEDFWPETFFTSKFSEKDLKLSISHQFSRISIFNV